MPNEKDVKDTDVTSASEKGEENQVESPSTETGVKAEWDDKETPSKKDDTVPLEAVLAERKKRQALEKELEELKAQLNKKSPSDTEVESKETWNDFIPEQPATQPVQTTDPQQAWKQFNEQLQEMILDGKVYEAFTALQAVAEADRRRREAVIKNQPDYRDLEPDMYNVPDEAVTYAQTNPDMIRFLLAFRRKHMQNQNKTNQTQTSQISNTENLSEIEKLRQKYREEGRKETLQKLAEQTGLVAESSSTGAGADISPEEDRLAEENIKQLEVMYGRPLTSEEKKRIEQRVIAYLKGEADPRKLRQKHWLQR